jgi:hypothetical protein
VAAGAADLARFAPHPDWFVCGEHAGMACVQAWAPAERLVEHFVALAAHLASAHDDTVDVYIHDARGERRWAGARVPLAETRDALTRVRLLLAAYGQAEISLATATDQLVLTPSLLLVIYATTPRWPYLCEARGLVQRSQLPAPDWRAPRAVPSAPVSGDIVAPHPLTVALAALAERLGLMEVVA